jgi:hypothetical protein
VWHRRDLREEATHDQVETPDWWGLIDYLAIFVALLQSIAIPFLALACLFLLISIVLIMLAG